MPLLNSNKGSRQAGSRGPFAAKGSLGGLQVRNELRRQLIQVRRGRICDLKAEDSFNPFGVNRKRLRPMGQGRLQISLNQLRFAQAHPRTEVMGVERQWSRKFSFGLGQIAGGKVNLSG